MRNISMIIHNPNLDLLPIPAPWKKNTWIRSPENCYKCRFYAKQKLIKRRSCNWPRINETAVTLACPGDARYSYYEWTFLVSVVNLYCALIWLQWKDQLFK